MAQSDPSSSQLRHQSNGPLQQHDVNAHLQGIYFKQFETLYRHDAQKENPLPANPTTQQHNETRHIPQQGYQMDMNHVGMNYAQSSYQSFEPQIYADHTQKENYNSTMMTPMWRQSNGPQLSTSTNANMVYPQEVYPHSLEPPYLDVPQTINYNAMNVHPISSQQHNVNNHLQGSHFGQFETNYHQAENRDSVAVNPTPTSGMIQQHNMIGMKCHISDQHQQYHRAAIENAEISYALQPSSYLYQRDNRPAERNFSESFEKVRREVYSLAEDYDFGTANCAQQPISFDPVERQIYADDAKKENCNPMVMETAHDGFDPFESTSCFSNLSPPL